MKMKSLRIIGTKTGGDRVKQRKKESKTQTVVDGQVGAVSLPRGGVGL